MLAAQLKSQENINVSESVIEDKLLRQSVSGDKQAFEHLIAEIYNDVYRLSFYLFKDQTQAEDLTHDVIIKIAAAIKQFKFECAFLTWVYRIVLNTFRDQYKKSNNRMIREGQYSTAHQQGVDSITPEQTLELKELLQAIDQLPDQLKLPLVLTATNNLTHSQIAEIFECPANTISWRIAEAKRQLKVILEKQS